MIPLLPTYWLEGLLAVSGAVTLCGLFYNQIKLKRHISAVEDDAYRSERKIKAIEEELYVMPDDQDLRYLVEDIGRLKSRLDLLDKPSNDRALAKVAKNINKQINSEIKLSKKSISTKSIAGSKLKKANGARHARN